MRSEGFASVASRNCCREEKNKIIIKIKIKSKSRVVSSICCIPKRLQRQRPGTTPGCRNALPREPRPFVSISPKGVCVYIYMGFIYTHRDL